ncbi:MAG: hypothetical protein GF353_07785, partial [Candidatus Lokiarchaeota archaeon]|nr:hypothetical protein [Candidatus Lokiarchaeota archaeon]
VLLQNLIVHDNIVDDDNNGITCERTGIIVRNCIVYNIAEHGVIANLPGITVTVQNVTVFNCGDCGIDVHNGATMNVQNCISMNCEVKDFRNVGSTWGTVSNNMSSDNSAPGPSNLLITNAQDVFVSIRLGQENFKLLINSPALEAGLDLSNEFAYDIRSILRPINSNWDIGAYEGPFYSEDDSDGDLIPDFVEILLGTNADDANEVPDVAIPTNWIEKNEDDLTLITYSFSNITGYTNRSIGFSVADNSQIDHGNPIVSIAKNEDYVSLPSLPVNYEIKGEVFNILPLSSNESAFFIPLPDNADDWLTRFAKLYNFHNGVWEEIGFDYATNEAIYFTSGSFSPMVIAGPTNPVVFVDANVLNSGDGQSWITAKKTVIEALSAVSSGQEIWVAEGTYYVSLNQTTETDRTVTFEIPENIAIYGGFKAGSIFSKRDPEAYKTILSGSLGNSATETDNAYTVVKTNSSCIIDGFVITDGYADYFWNPNPEWRGGAGMYIPDNTSNTTIRNCIFLNNKALTFHGPDHNWGQGSAIWIQGSNTIVDNCQFLFNISNFDGAVTIEYSAGSTVLIQNSYFEGNHCIDWPPESYDLSTGGAISCGGQDAIVQNCIFVDNEAGNGGAIKVYSNDININNCTFFKNAAFFGDGGAVDLGWGNATITNSIFWENSSVSGHSEIQTYLSYPVSVERCIVEGGFSGNNLDVDPLFVNKDKNDLRLKYNSPAIDAADGATAPIRDYKNSVRFDDPNITNTGINAPNYADIGAYELATANFTDVTAQVDLDNADAFRASIADLNNDGYPDLVLHAQDDQKTNFLKLNKLYLNTSAEPGNPSSEKRKFVDVSVADPTTSNGIWLNRAGTSVGRLATLAIFGDVDNDGDLDMYSGRYYHRESANFDLDGMELLLNDGNANFTLSGNCLNQALPNPRLNNSAAVFTDYNLDGNIDLYLGHWYYQGESFDNNNQNLNQTLLSGNGAGQFSYVPSVSGTGSFYSVDAADVNNNGYPDLFAPSYANNQGQALSYHWENINGSSFMNKATQSNFAQYIGLNNRKSGFGSYPRDYDNDGDIDFLMPIVHGSGNGGVPDATYGSNTFPNFVHTTVITNDGSGNFNWRFDNVLDRDIDDPYLGHHGDQNGTWTDIDNAMAYSITERGAFLSREKHLWWF